MGTKKKTVVPKKVILQKKAVIKHKTKARDVDADLESERNRLAGIRAGMDSDTDLIDADISENAKKILERG